jgi:hypothetical protein
MTTLAESRTRTVEHALTHYYDDLRRAAAAIRRDRTSEPDGFTPEFDLPPLSPALEAFYSLSRLDLRPLGTYNGTELTLLDLMGNPRTRTTKTPASLLMVARAVHHIQRTGEPVMIITPSSANKATALRDAVLRAIECDLVTPDQLRIVVIVPQACTPKLWSSPLSTDPALARRNPVLVYPGADRSQVKVLARAVADECTTLLHELAGIRLWYSLDIDNYRMADAARAFFEQEQFPTRSGRSRLHAHAVSSAYGLLGHHLGHTVAHADAAAAAPGYFLVQHLDTPDMVLDLHFGSADHRHIPEYSYDRDSGLFHQSADPRFPATTFDPAEILDPTFYTRRPPTSPEMNALIGAGGGGGIVVSLHECLQRYAALRARLASAGVTLPADPRQVREWSLVMGATGVLNALDRGLITADEVVLHGSGCYSTTDYTPLAADVPTVVAEPRQARQEVLHAALAGESA